MATMIFQTLGDAGVSLLISSWLTCGATTWLRATCRGCAKVFVRNIPPMTSETLYFEDRERPPGDTIHEPKRREMICEHPHRNRLSPLRCWRFQLADALKLGAVNQNLARRLLRKRSVVLAAVAYWGIALEYADDSLKGDREIVLAAVAQCGGALRWADESLKRDRDVVLAAVTQGGYALLFADDTMRLDRDLTLAAVSQCGRALRWADKSFKRDREIVLTAIKNWDGAAEYADESLRRDLPEIVAAARQQRAAAQQR